jgi:hypothetical protein
MPSNWDECVENLTFKKITNSTSAGLPGGEDFQVLGTSGSEHGQLHLAEITGAELRDDGKFDEAKKVAESFILKYLFTRLTGLEIFEEKLTDSDLNAIELVRVQTLLNDYVIPAIQARFPLDGGFSNGEDIYWSKLSADDMSDLLVPVTNGDPEKGHILESNVTKLDKLLRPQQKREGPLVYMQEPLIQKAEQILSELLFSSIYLKNQRILRKVFIQPRMFDTIIGINFSDLSGHFDMNFETTKSAAGDNFLVTVLDEDIITGDEVAATSIDELLLDAVHGKITIDNYTFMISTTLDSGGIY